MTISIAPRGLLVLLAIGAMAGCCPSDSYEGDGEMVSESCWPFHNYEVRFPAVEIGGSRKATFLVERLPATEDAVAGFMLSTPPPLTCEQLKATQIAAVKAKLIIVDSSGQTLVGFDAPLSEWVWNYSLGAPGDCFLYTHDLDVGPELGEALRLHVDVSSTVESPLKLEPTIKSFANYVP